MAKYKVGDVVLIEAVIVSVDDSPKHIPHIYTIKTDANLGIRYRVCECTEDAIAGLKAEVNFQGRESIGH